MRGGGEEGYLAAIRALSRRILFISSVSRRMICCERAEEKDREVRRGERGEERRGNGARDPMGIPQLLHLRPRERPQPRLVEGCIQEILSGELTRGVSDERRGKRGGRGEGILLVAHLYAHGRLLEQREHGGEVLALQNLRLLWFAGSGEEGRGKEADQ
jgi:hypothetical protein